MSRRIPHAEVELHGDYRATYIRRRLSDGVEWKVTRTFLARAHFMEALARWNRQQPHRWAYREAQP